MSLAESMVGAEALKAALPENRNPFDQSRSGGDDAEEHHDLNNGVDTRTIQAYLGHRNIMLTVRYTLLAPDRFRTVWRD